MKRRFLSLFSRFFEKVFGGDGKPHRHPFGMPPVRVAAPSVHIVQSTRVLLAAAPTTPPCFRHWRRSSLLPTRGGLGKEVRLCEMPRPPLLGGLSPQVTGGLSRKLLKSNPHRHCFAMPPPLIGAALAKRSGFAKCQGPPY